MSGSAAKEARREIRRAIGEGGLQALDEITKDLKTFKYDTNRQIGTLLLLLGKHTDRDLEQPLLLRFDMFIENSVDLAHAMQSHLERELALNRSFWRRLKWLLVGS